ncbi:MAG: GAF domain-containing protein [Chloroflexota bacterium]|nr:MAG: GAF domain-containing protein [Chloroflexota bacterium]
MEIGNNIEPIELNGGKDRTTRASLELIYHVSREFAAALDLRAVLERVLLLSMKTVGAMSGSIIVMDDSGKPVESAIVTGAEVHNHATQRLRVTLERGLAGWVARNRRAVLVNDTSQDERWITRRYEADEYNNPKSAVSAPVMVRERLVGVMTLAHESPGFFKEDDLDLLQAIADQAGIAILNARLYAESQRQARVMTGLAESAAAITATLNLEDVLVRILEQIGLAMQVQAVSLALIDTNREELVFRAAIGWAKQANFTTRLALGKSIAGWVAREGRGVVIADACEDARFDDETNARTGIQTKAIACAPIRSRGQVIGVLEALNPKEGVFDSDAMLVLTGIGSLAGTAIRHAQLFERLQAAHQRYRELFEDSIDPIVITDWKGKVLEANRQAEAATGTSKDTLRGTTIDCLHKIDITVVGDHFQNLNDGETQSYESTLKNQVGKEIPVQVYTRQVNIDDISHLQWIFRDITERKNLDTLRTDLLSMIYHDLRSPLSNVVSSLDTVASILSENNDPSLVSLINIAMRSTERIQRLTDSLLDINRMEAGQPVGNRHPCNILQLAEEAIEIVHPTLENKNQEANVAIPAGLAPVSGDADMIRRILTNLLDNAVKYTPQDGKIRVGAARESEWVRVWVEDTGPGIPKSEHERIFEKFARLSSGEASKGLGLGLTYCRMAVEAHGGQIWVESEPGAGSRFVFTLPAATE